MEAVLRLLDADLGSNAADRHGSDGPDFRQRVAQCHLKASVNDADVRQQVLWILDQLYDTAHNLTGTCLELRAASSHAVVQDRDNYGE